MRTNFDLLKAIREAELNQRDLSRLTGIHETLISRYVNGGLIPTKRQQLTISKALGVPIGRLFQ